MATTITGDFIGFTYNNIHSTEFGVIRTSNGDRYENSLIPDFEDQSTQIPGKDGSYYFRTDYSTKTFSIPIAFDTISEEDFRRFNKHFGDKKLHYLTFDEAPYKSYHVKIASAPSLEYLCFEEGNNKRVYKGEGTLEFVAYEPFAITTIGNNGGFKKYLDNYTEENKLEWAAASGMLETKGDYDKYKLGDTTGKGYFKILNPGDLDTPFGLKLDFVDNIIEQTEISIFKNGIKDNTKVLNINKIKKSDITTDVEIKSIYIDSRTHLIYALDTNGNNTNILLNKYIGLGDFFNLPICHQSDEAVILNIASNTSWTAGEGKDTDKCVITYFYRYF